MGELVTVDDYVHAGCDCGLWTGLTPVPQSYYYWSPTRHQSTAEDRGGGARMVDGVSAGGMGAARMVVAGA